MIKPHNPKTNRVVKGKGKSSSGIDRRAEKPLLNDRRKFFIEAASALGAGLVLGKSIQAKNYAAGKASAIPVGKPEIRRLIGRLQRDPGLIDELLNAGQENKRKGSLVKRGLLQQGDHPTRDEIVQEMQSLLLPPGSPAGGSGGRMVEWVGAIATAAAGAAAAACTVD